LAKGLPFGPQAGLERRDVFVTEDEAVFLFEPPARHVLEPLLADSAWAAGPAWKDLVAGPPRLAEPVYEWLRSDEDDGLSSAATPGPGDSDGGDIFAP
jgi:hypothetical protein